MADALRVAIFGPTGVAGTGVRQAWLEDPRVVEVRAVTRRTLPLSSPGLTEVRCEDFLDLSAIASSLEGLDAVCFCLGISASQAKSRAEYRTITHDFALAAALTTRERSPDAIFHFISGSGTSESSWMNWARVKAETERDLAGVGLGGCVCWRPAMILPEAPPESLAWFQQLGSALARPLRFAPDFSVDNTAIGEATIQATLEGRRDGVIENREIRALAQQYRSSRTGG